MGSGGSGAGGAGGTGGGGYSGGGLANTGGTGYGGDLGGYGTAGETSGGAGGAGMAGYGGGGTAGDKNSGWGGPMGSAGPNTGTPSGALGFSSLGQAAAVAPSGSTVVKDGQLYGVSFSFVKGEPKQTMTHIGPAPSSGGYSPPGLANTGGTGYGGDLGGYGTAGEMSGGAGGAGLAGYGGGGIAGVQGSGFGGPNGGAGRAAGFGGPVGGVSAPSTATSTAPVHFSQSLPTVTSPLLTPKSMFGVLGPPPKAPGFLGQPYGIDPSQVNPGFGYSPGMKGPFGVGGKPTAQGYQGINPGLRDRMGGTLGGSNLPSVGKGPQGYSGGAYGNTRGPVGVGGPSRRL